MRKCLSRVAVIVAISTMAAARAFGQGGINIAAEGTDQLWRGASSNSHAGAWLDQGAMNSSDDRRDLIVGAPGSATTLGHAYVIFGGPANSGTFTLTAANGVLNGATAGDLFGSATAAGNIVTTEGSTVRDLAIGAPGALAGRGIVYVFTGGVEQGDSINASAAVIRILGAAGDRLGTSLATADLDGDGYREILIGAPGTSRVYVIRGGRTVSGDIDLSTTAAASVISAPGIGRTLVTGDITGDGRYDVIISAPYEDGSTGRVYVLFGRTGGFPSTLTLPAQASVQYTGVNPGDQAGMGLRLGDIDGDGTKDLLIGSPGADPPGRTDAGAVYVIMGGPSLAGGPVSTTARVIVFGEAAGYRTGTSIESGDINRDTPNDIVMLAAGARSGQGELHVIYGGARSSLPGIVDLANGMARRMYADPSAGPITSAVVFEVTGEGARDIIIGVPDAATPAGAGAGQVYFSLSPKLVLGSTTAQFTAPQGSSGHGRVMVLNPGVGIVTWTATSSASWLRPAASGEASASNPGVLDLSTDTTLAAGTYTATVTVKSTSPHLIMSKFLTVTFTVRACEVGGRGTSDFNGDSCADLVVFRRGTGEWFVQDQGTFKWGLPTDIPVPGDYDGNGSTDIAVYRPSTSTWYVYGQSGIQYGMPGDIPVPADYDGDGRTDIAVYRPSNRTWYVMNQFAIQWGVANDTPVPADYDGDGRADIAVYRRSTGMWYIRNVGNVKWGGPGYAPVPADYNGDRRSDIAVVGTATGTWYVKDQFTTTWGMAGDIAFAFDRDGDNAAELVVFRPSTNLWYIRNMVRVTTTTESWGGSGDVPAILRAPVLNSVASDADADRKADLVIWRPDTGDWWMTYRNGAFDAYNRYHWGLSTDKPVAADYDGDGKVDPAVFRPSNGYWYVLLSTTDYTGWWQPILFGGSSDKPVPGDYVGNASAQLAYWRPSTGAWVVMGGPSATIGASGDVPVPADFDGDGRTDMAVFRPSTGQWMIRTSSSEFATLTTSTFGASGDTPVAADFDGDGRADLAYFHPSDGTWHVMQSATSSVLVVSWGLSTDVPVPGDFDGDGVADIAVWRPDTGMWYVRNQFTFRWGMTGDVPVLER